MDNIISESYSFSHSNSHGVMTTLSFIVPTEGTHISTFHSMCRKFAIALGYAEGTSNTATTGNSQNGSTTGTNATGARVVGK